MKKENGYRSRENLRDLLIELVKTDFKLRYNNSLLGFLWVLIKPFVLFTILYTVFSHFFGRGDGIPNYPLYLLLGIITFQFFSEGTINGLYSLINKSGIILKVNFPKEIAVIGSTVIAIINYSINLIVFGVFSLYFGSNATPITILYFIFVIGILYLFILTVAYLLSVMFVKLRDLSHIWELGLQVLFYLTPIIYPMEFLNQPIYSIVALNPLTRVILSAREALIYGKVEYLKSNLILLGALLPLFLLSKWIFTKLVKQVAEEF